MTNPELRTYTVTCIAIEQWTRTFAIEATSPKEACEIAASRDSPHRPDLCVDYHTDEFIETTEEFDFEAKES